jgi:hypothetical protein
LAALFVTALEWEDSMRKARIVLAVLVLLAFTAAMIWQLASRYSRGPTQRHPPRPGATADSSFFVPH